MTSTQGSEFLLFEVAGQCFALDAATVMTVLAPQSVTPLPFVPPYLEGLVYINEQVMTLIDLAAVLKPGQQNETDRSEWLALNPEVVPCAIRVDRIVAKVMPDEVEVETGDEGDGQLTELVSGRFRYEGSLVMVLSVTGLAGLLGHQQVPQGEAGLLGRVTGEVEQSLSLTHCLVFRVAAERYALRLLEVVEILDLPEATPIPGAPAEVEGLISVRDEVLLVLDTSRLLGRPVDGAAAEIVVVEISGRRYGLRVTAVEGIREMDEAEIRLLDDEQAALIGVLSIDDKLIGLLSPSSLLPEARQSRLIGLMPRVHQRAEEQVKTREFLEVRFGRELIALPLNAVAAIADQAMFEAVSEKNSDGIAGVAHVKNEVLPVIDCGALLRCGDYQAIDTGAQLRRCWLLLQGSQGRWVVPADEARQIRVIDERHVEMLEGAGQRLVEAVINLPSGMVPVISMAALEARL